MHTLGLHGKSFIPLIMGFGCNVPAIMAARTLETRRDRLLTILINPLMSCSARLPVYVLIASAFFPGKEGNIIFAIYFLGIVLAIIMGQLFSKTLFKGETTPFVMELPPYRMPTLLSVMIHMWEKTKVYLQKMGGVVLAFSIVIWFLGNFPKDIQYDPELVSAHQTIESSIEERCKGSEAGVTDSSSECGELEAQLVEIKSAMENQRLAESYIGRLGHAVEPLIAPLGFDWRLGVSLITGFVAKEVVVSTMGVLYQAGNTETGSAGLVNALKKSGLTPVTAFGFMVFVLIYVPCMVTVVTIWRETGSLGWTCFAVGYLMTLAWVMAFVIRAGCLVMKCAA
jgi:ferrous iron transport protein B